MELVFRKKVERKKKSHNLYLFYHPYNHFFSSSLQGKPVHVMCLEGFSQLCHVIVTCYHNQIIQFLSIVGEGQSKGSDDDMETDSEENRNEQIYFFIRHFQVIISPLSHHCLTNVSPMYHQCLTIVSPLTCISSHHCLTLDLPYRLTIVSPLFHHCVFVSPLSHPCLTYHYLHIASYSINIKWIIENLFS